MEMLLKLSVLVCCLATTTALSPKFTSKVAESTHRKSTSFEKTAEVATEHDHDYPVEESTDCKDIYPSKRCRHANRVSNICQTRENQLCKLTCHVCHQKAPAPVISCSASLLGCCWDGVTSKRDPYGAGCPECKDDDDYAPLCGRWVRYCRSEKPRDTVMREVVQKHCHETCGKCGNTRIHHIVQNTLPPISVHESYSNNKPRSGAKYVWTKVKVI